MNVELKSGRVVYASGGIVGINSELVVYGGYDHVVFDDGLSFFLDEAPDLTKEEQSELADLMILRWSQFKARAENG